MLPFDRALFALPTLPPAATPAPIDLLRQRFDQRFELREAGDRQRPALQQFIQRCFAESHAARIGHFMPRLLGLHERDSGLIAAFGLRAGNQGPLFLENYLDAPIEQVLARHAGRPILRDEIMEVGNLSATHAGATRWLILAITLQLYHEGYRWISFTATTLVRNAVGRLGLLPWELGAATLARLPAHEHAQWGDYYRHAPVVMAGELATGIRSLRENQALLRLLGNSRGAA